MGTGRQRSIVSFLIHQSDKVDLAFVRKKKIYMQNHWKKRRLVCFGAATASLFRFEILIRERRRKVTFDLDRLKRKKKMTIALSLLHAAKTL